MHLHDQIARFAPQLVALPCSKEQENGGKSMNEERRNGQAVGPAQVVPVGVHLPVATSMRASKYCNREEHEDSSNAHANEVDRTQNPLVLQDKFEWPPAQLTGHSNLCSKAEQKGYGHEGLHDDQPRRQQPFADHIVLQAEHVVAAVEQVIKLEVRISKVFEAVLPQAHVLEGGERFRVRLHPVRAAERNQQ